MGTDIRELRLRKQIQARDMVEVVQELYPKYDATLQSKCERGDAYGVEIKPDAAQLPMERFAADELEAQKRSRHGKHRLTCSVRARLPNDVFEALQVRIRADGYATTQDWLADMVQRYLQEGQDV